MKQFSFGKCKRLASNAEFKALVSGNMRASNGLLIVYMRPNDCGYPRLGVSVGKSCGGAVVRNRAKRLLREAFRQNQEKIPAGFDYLLMISPRWSKKVNGFTDSEKAMRRITFEQVRTSFLTLIDRLSKRRQKTWTENGR